MKFLWGLALWWLLPVAPGHAQVTPAPTALPPLLQIFEPKVTGATMTQMAFDEQRPLLTVQKIRDARLAPDGKGVLITLGPEDAKTFSKISSDFNDRPLIFRTAGGVTRLININGAVDDGQLGFKYPEAAPLADDLRRALELGEFEKQRPLRPPHPPLRWGEG